MDSSFFLFVLFSFILIALFIFILLYIDQLQKIRRYFKWRQSIIYLLGSVSILVSLALSYFISCFFSVKLAIVVFILLNGTAVYLLLRASTILRRDEKEGQESGSGPD